MREKQFDFSKKYRLPTLQIILLWFRGIKGKKNVNNIPFDRYINIFQEDENAQKSDHIVGNTKTNIDC